MGVKVDPQKDDVRVDGRRIKAAARLRYILLYKPSGFVTTRSDPERRRTVLDLIAGVREYVYPVGRLDYDSEGLLLLTNDGELAATLTHPRHGVARVYDVRVAGEPDRHDLERLARGLMIDGRRTQPADVKSLGPGHFTIAIREGRNRQIREMCDAIGHPVDRLRRIAIGPISDARLKVGQWRELTDAEVRRLRAAGDARLKPSRSTRETVR